MLTGTPKLYASTFTMRTHEDRYITYEFLAVVYGTFLKAPCKQRIIPENRV